MSLSSQEALSLLGITTTAPDAVESAYRAKKAEFEQKREQAPTKALQAKFDTLLRKLDQARSSLLESAGAESGEKTQSPDSDPASRSSLSRTKLADLPQASASHTGFEGDQPGAQLNLEPGTVLAGRYEIRERIGAGGMGAVFRAFDRNTEREIALKLLLPGLMKNERARERFLSEAKLSQQLSHPGIANVHDVQHEGDLYFLTMELLEGQDLRQVMDNRALARQPFNEKELKELASALGEALAYAHQHTVHRDIKPENVWLSEDGDYKLMDFGIARAQSTSQRTQTGAAMGTAYYMAPEQLKGRKDIDGRADQYALGVMLYELATGEVPAGVIKPLRQHRKDLSRGFCEAVMRALSADPQERHADMNAFVQALSSRGSVSLGALLPGKGGAIAAAVLLLAVGLGTGAATGTFTPLWEALAPMSADERRALRDEAVRLQSQVNSLARRLDNARRGLDSDVRDAERNESEDLASLRHWREVTERSLFGGTRLDELEGERAVAEALLRDQDYGEAAAAFGEVHEGYRGLLDEFTAAERLHDGRLAAEQAMADYVEWAGNNDVPKLDQLAGIEAGFHEAGRREREGLFQQAYQQYSDTEESVRSLKSVVGSLVEKRTSVLARQSNWRNLKSDYSLEGGEGESSADQSLEAAHQLFARSNPSGALEQYQQAAGQYQALGDDNAERMAKIDQQRADAQRRAEQERRRREEARRVARLRRSIEQNEIRLAELRGQASGFQERMEQQAQSSAIVRDNNLRLPVRDPRYEARRVVLGFDSRETVCLRSTPGYDSDPFRNCMRPGGFLDRSIERIERDIRYVSDRYEQFSQRYQEVQREISALEREIERLRSQL